MGAEMLLSMINERRLGAHAEPLRRSRKMKWAKRLVNAGLGLQLLRRPRVASVLLPDRRAAVPLRMGRGRARIGA